MNMRSDLYLLSKILAKCEVRTASYEPSFMPGGEGTPYIRMIGMTVVFFRG